MNTIHTTFNNPETVYTVIGAHKKEPDHPARQGLSVLLLNRGGRPFREELFKELSRLDVTEIISVENRSLGGGDFEEYTSLYENLRFILTDNCITPGEKINIGITEALCDNIFVIWNDMQLNSRELSHRLFQKIIEKRVLCTVPVLHSYKGQLIPTCMTPLSSKGILKVLALENKELGKSLFPFDYTGIYNKEKFIRSGGYDYYIKNPYWQKMDFGLRAYLWGEEILPHSSLKVSFTTDRDLSENTTPDASYRLCYLKNLSVRFNGDSGVLPLSRFIKYFDKSGSTLTDAWRDFQRVRAWVKTNRYRFTTDASAIIQLWDNT